MQLVGCVRANLFDWGRGSRPHTSGTADGEGREAVAHDRGFSSLDGSAESEDSSGDNSNGEDALHCSGSFQGG